ncbi:MAG: acetyl-CoA hydrolase, partial [Dokdonella sp.]
MRNTIELTDTAACVESILVHAGAHVVLAAPLGLGKPNALINAIYRRVASDACRRLTVHTALSLALPSASGDLQQRFLKPFVDRHFGVDHEQLDYVAALRADRLPANVRIHEFYFQSGAMLDSSSAQQDYASLNYTHVARQLAGQGINVVVHLVARRGERISLSCNPDVTLDLLDDIAQAKGERPLLVGVVNADLPFLGGDADVPLQLFDILLCDPGHAQRLFAVPREDVDDVEHAIGLHASSLVRDGGTLQIGIGALSDALVHALLLRHRQNDDYVEAIARLQERSDVLPVAGAAIGGLEPFQQGLNGSSEMIMDGFMHLREAGILVRRVHADAPLQRALDARLIDVKMRPGDAHRLYAADGLPARIDAVECARLVRIGLLPVDALFADDSVVLADGRRVGSDLASAENLAALDEIMTGRSLQGGTYLQGGFHLGSNRLYDWLRSLDGENYAGLSMQRVTRINQLA